MATPDQEPQIIHIQTPSTHEQWEGYYRLRWTILRKPWGMPVGSEKDHFEPTAHHLAAIQLPSNQIVGCARFHLLSPDQAQIRYMAIDSRLQRKGVGSQLIQHLEAQALQLGVKTLVLNARETAASFYRLLGYQIIGPAEPFLGIEHFRMIKSLH